MSSAKPCYNGVQSVNADLQPNQARFLAAFATSGRVLQASRWAKVSRNSHYMWLREDPTYPARFDEAMRNAARALEDECVRRASEGVKKAIFYKGKVVGYEHEYSDSLLLALLRAYMPDRFRERSSVEHSGPGGAAIPSTLTVEFVRPSESASRRIIDVTPTEVPALAAPVIDALPTSAMAPEPANERELGLMAEVARLKAEGDRLRRKALRRERKAKPAE